MHLSTAHSPNPQFLAPDQDIIVELMFQFEVDDGRKTAFDMVGSRYCQSLGDVTQDGKLDSAGINAKVLLPDGVALNHVSRGALVPDGLILTHQTK